MFVLILIHPQTGAFCPCPRLGRVETRHALSLQTAARWPYLVWEEQGRVKGYCYAHPWKERPAYRHTLETTVYLDPACTGRGIGTRLMHALIGECRGRGAHALVACITAGNEPSCRLHRRLGFRQVSEFHDVGFKHGQWLGVVDYELRL